MAASLKLPLIPASFFGMVLGLFGLANAWRVGARIWRLPALVGEVLTFVTLAGALGQG